MSPRRICLKRMVLGKDMAASVDCLVGWLARLVHKMLPNAPPSAKTDVYGYLVGALSLVI